MQRHIIIRAWISTRNPDVLITESSRIVASLPRKCYANCDLYPPRGRSENVQEHITKHISATRSAITHALLSHRVDDGEVTALLVADLPCLVPRSDPRMQLVGPDPDCIMIVVPWDAVHCG